MVQADLYKQDRLIFFWATTQYIRNEKHDHKTVACRYLLFLIKLDILYIYIIYLLLILPILFDSIALIWYAIQLLIIHSLVLRVVIIFIVRRVWGRRIWVKFWIRRVYIVSREANKMRLLRLNIYVNKVRKILKNVGHYTKLIAI